MWVIVFECLSTNLVNQIKQYKKWHAIWMAQASNVLIQLKEKTMKIKTNKCEKEQKKK